MYHSSLDSNDIYNITHSVGYPVLSSLTNKLKLCVSDYSIVQQNNKEAEYVLALENGVNVLNLSYMTDGKMVAALVDTPYGAANGAWQHSSTIVSTKSTSYLIRAATTDSRTAGVKLKARIDDLCRNGLSVILSNLLSNTRNKATNDLRTLRSISDQELHFALSVVFENAPVSSIPPNILANLQGRYEDFNTRVSQQDKYMEALESVFRNEKWIVMARPRLSAASGVNDYSCYIGALDAGALLIPAKRGYFTERDLPEMTVPIQLYRNLLHVPPIYCDQLIGTLSMFKQYRLRNHPQMKSIDSRGLIPQTSFLFDVDSGSVALLVGSTTVLMIDK